MFEPGFVDKNMLSRKNNKRVASMVVETAANNRKKSGNCVLKVAQFFSMTIGVALFCLP